jgi:hypothetical protein
MVAKRSKDHRGLYAERAEYQDKKITERQRERKKGEYGKA